MTVARICPACSTQLPKGYPYDHVAIDLALKGKTTLTTDDEIGEAVRTGLARGMSMFAVCNRLHLHYSRAERLAGTAAAAAARIAELDALVARMAALGYTAWGIARDTGYDRNAVRRSMQRQGFGKQRAEVTG